jgi:small conductance mechanosensitive channel
MNIQKLYDMAFRWLEAHGPSILMAILIFTVGQWIIRLIRKWLIRAMERREISSSIRPFFQSLILTLLQVLLILVVLQILSVRMTIFTAIVTSFGVAAGLALSGTLQNFTGGVLILLIKPFRVGDNIIAQGHDGIVDSIEIFYTIVTTFDNRTVIIPNSKVSNEVIVNISRQGSRRLDVEMKFPFTVAQEDVVSAMMKSVLSSPDILKDPKPIAGVSVFDPDGYKVMLQVWIDALRYNPLKLSLQEKLLNDLKRSGIKFLGMP